MTRMLTRPKSGVQAGSAPATGARGKDAPIFTSGALSVVQIRESFDAGSKLVVDRAAGVIRNVKVLGTSSPNSHGRRGIVGTDYLESSHRSLVSLMESRPGGVMVNKNHTERTNPNRDRRIDERLGWLKEPRVDSGETYANFYALDMTDPDTVKVFEAAEKNPYCFAMSIDADGHYEIKGNRLKIDRFNKVRSVDVVTDGGTTISLAESQRKGIAMTLREALEKIGFTNKQTIRIFEMGDSLLKPDTTIEKPDAPAADADATDKPQTWRAILADAIKAVLEDATMDEGTAKEKIEAILGALTGGTDEAEAVSEIMGGETPADGATPLEEGDEGGDEKPVPPVAKKGGEGDDKEKKKMEVASKEAKELQTLRTEKNVRRLCESMQFQPSELQVKAMAGLDDAERKQYITELKGKGTGKQAGNPIRSGGPASGTGYTRVNESLSPKTAAEQAKLLTSRR